MALEQDAKQVFSNFKLEPVRHTANFGHLFADYVELWSCLRNGDVVSKADLVNRFRDYDVSVPYLSGAVAGPPTQQERKDLTSAEVDDKYDDWATQVFSIIETRLDVVRDAYPFELEKKCVRIIGSPSSRQQLYLILLMCSNLHYFRGFTDLLTSDFEQVALEALKNFLPDFAIVRQLGKKSDYPGNAQQKIKALAGDLNVAVNEHELEKVEGNQERGLDVVGWIPFSDRFANLLCILGQCACGQDWNAKLSETRRFEYSYFFFKKLNPIHAMFIPRGLYHNKDFFESGEISGSLIFDRCRILHLINDDALLMKLNSHIVVKAYIDSMEAVA
jgi:hypothetical protein